MSKKEKATYRHIKSQPDGIHAETEDGQEILAPPIKYMGYASRYDGSSASGVLQFTDKHDKDREILMPAEWTASDPKKFADMLISNGYDAVGHPEHIDVVRAHVIYESHRSKRRLLLVDIGGWHGEHFLLGDTLISPKGQSLEVRLDGSLAQAVGRFGTAGTLENWQREVAARAIHSDIMLTAIYAAFAPPLLKLVKVQGGALNFPGERGSGKTATLTVAGSAYGGPGYVVSWNMTEGGSDTLALVYNDLILLIDELAAFDPNPAAGAKRLPNVVHRLSDGIGRVVSIHAPGNINQHTDKLFLSTSEKSSTRYMLDGGQDPSGGLNTRLTDVPVDPKSTTGIFNHPLPENPETGQPYHYSDYARLIVVAAIENYGHAGRLFLQKLAQERHDSPEKLINYISDRMKHFTDKTRNLVPPGYDLRIIRRFAAVYAAGKLALRYGVLPPACDHVFRAVKYCLTAAIGQHNVGQPAPQASNLEQLLALVSAKDGSVITLGPKEKVPNTKAFEACKAIVMPSLVDQRQKDALVKKEVFDALFPRPKAVCAQLSKDGILVLGPENRISRRDRIPGIPEKVQVYRLYLHKLKTLRLAVR